MSELLLVLAVLLLIAVLSARHYYLLYQRERSTKSSLATKHGLTFEQLAPFARSFPGDFRAFRFIGDPVDGVLFGDDEVTFVEFKSGRSQLTEKQKRIRKLIEERRVEWREVRS